jgi:hypothetical protein
MPAQPAGISMMEAANMSHSPAFDQPEHKPTAGGEVLWSIRAWVIGTCCSVPVEQRIAKVLTKIAGRHAAQSLFGYMLAVTSGAQRKISIACMCNHEINRDEQTLLDILALYQRDKHVEAMMLLRSIVSAPAAAEAREAGEEFSRLLVASGHWLAPPSLASTQDMELIFGDEVALSGVRVTLN